jgi:hypothetical protein
VPVLYPIAVAVLSPEYFEFVRQFGPHYAKWGSGGPVLTALVGDGSWAAIGALTAYLVFRSAMITPRLWDSLAIAVAAAFVAAVLQQKGWRYHFYPAIAMGLFLLSGITLEIAGRELVTAVRRSAAVLALAGTLTLLTTTAFVAVRGFAEGVNWDRTTMGRLIEWTKLQSETRLLMIDAGGIEASVAFHAGKIPVSRVANMYALDPAYARQSRGDTHRQGTASAPMNGPAGIVFSMTLNDFRRGDPLLLMIDESGADRVYFLDYFNRDSVFADLFSQYTFLGTIEKKQAFRRLRPGETRVQPPQPRFDPPSHPVLGVLSLRKRRVAVFLGFLLVLAFAEVRRRPLVGKRADTERVRPQT